MATNSTIFKADLQVTDTDRDYYETHKLTLARHPSETDERLMMRLLVFALHADEALEFAGAISTEETPALWKKNLSGEIQDWIELGFPDEKRIKKACGRARNVYIYCYGMHRAKPWWQSIQAKLDRFDNLSVLVFADGEALLVNPGGTVRLGLLLLAEAQKQLGRAGVSRALIAGELYYRHPSGARPRVHDVSHAARQPAGQAELDSLCFAAFDLIELDGQPAPGRHAETYARLQKLLGGGQRVHPVEAAQVKTVEEIEQYFGSWVEQQGGEGLVLRSDSAGGFKLKPRHTLDVAVVGFTESTDERKGLLHDLLVAVMRKDGSLHLCGRVGTGSDLEPAPPIVPASSASILAGSLSMQTTSWPNSDRHAPETKPT